ncbi:hypothetical protein [Actinopolymorpha alba]|uniref:hypothetical protein n=1 Tax=Actinopolymorpha alba TaxID=533267 RepID=UPI0003AB3AF2|nr:hypothetical protein [Actinopolymorpha alba]
MDSTSADTGRHPFSVLVERIRARLDEESGALLWSVPGQELSDLLVSLEAASPTAPSCAATTTASSTKEPGKSAWQRMAYPNSSHPNGSTNNATPSATNASEPDRPGAAEHHRAAD